MLSTGKYNVPLLPLRVTFTETQSPKLYRACVITLRTPSPVSNFSIRRPSKSSSAIKSGCIEIIFRLFSVVQGWPTVHAGSTTNGCVLPQPPNTTTFRFWNVCILLDLQKNLLHILQQLAINLITHNRSWKLQNVSTNNKPNAFECYLLASIFKVPHYLLSGYFYANIMQDISTTVNVLYYKKPRENISTATVSS